MKRRDFIKIGSTGLAAVALGQVVVPKVFRDQANAQNLSMAVAADRTVKLTMEEVMFEMADAVEVYHWAYRHTGEDGLGLRIPSPVLLAHEGDTLRINVTNAFPAGHGGSHAFVIPGVVESDDIGVGETAELTFMAPAAGTYMYFDPQNRPVNRAMGLHGALIVLPRAGNTPYSTPTANIQKLFNAFGDQGWAPGKGSADFPGHPWDPARTWIWIFGSADPELHARVRDNPSLDGATFINDYVPDYYTINGRGGFFGSHGHDIGPHGNVGQPALIRCINAGMAAHSPHIHGNHVYLLSEANSYGNEFSGAPLFTRTDELPRNGGLHTSVTWIDTWSMRPGDRKDLVLPFIVPPDIPRDPQKHLVQSKLSLAERQARGGDATPWPPVEETFPLIYPMHCHNELSQTLVGGNYPQGLVAHWQIDGDIDMTREDEFGANRSQTLSTVPGLNAVITVERAEVRVKFGKLSLEGAFSGGSGTVLEVFSDAPFSGSDRIGQTTVRADGTWSFQGRALKALAGRTVHLRSADESVERANIPLRLR